jgi:hypothetical protein
MSKVAELAYDIEQMYINGWGAYKIAEVLECPIDVVEQWLADNNLGDFSDEIEDDEIAENVFARIVEDLSPFETMNS